MGKANVDDDDGLWQFALRVYGAPGIEEACLELQDTNGVDVCCLLFAAWMADSSVLITAQEFAEIDEAVAAWRKEIVHKLRLMRRRLKTGPSPAPSPNTDRLREGVKAVELCAERVEIEMLEAEGLALANAKTVAARDQDFVLANLITVLRHYSDGEPNENARQCVTIIRDAI